MAEHPVEPKLTLYRGWPTQGEHVWSPFVIKLEARLRFAGISYQTAAGSPKAAPKGKIPYVEIPISDNAADGRRQMGDSTLIIKHLIETGAIPHLNSRLSPEDKARDLATRALLEDKLYFFHVSGGTSAGERDLRLTLMECVDEREVDRELLHHARLCFVLYPLASASPGGPNGVSLHQCHTLRSGHAEIYKRRGASVENRNMADH